MRWSGAATTASLAVAVAAISFSLLNQGTLRSLYFWWGIFPVYLHYRFIQFLRRDLGLMSQERADRLYADAHDRYSGVVRDIHYALRGYYLKNAQLLSTQPDLIPQAYMQWMQRTQDNVPSEFRTAGETKEFCRRRMREERGIDFDAEFADWEERPLGVASIGQVHRCRLRRTGEWVAVKLQFDNMEQRFRADLRTLKALCAFAMPQHVTGFDEVEKNFDAEFNYEIEAANLVEVRDAVLPRWGHLVNIPRPLAEYTSRSVLVMEFLQGDSLMAGLRRHLHAVAGLLNTTAAALEAEREQQLRSRTFRYRSIEEERALFRRVRLAQRAREVLAGINPLRLLRTAPTGGRAGPGGGRSRWGTGLLDLARILETLCTVHATELFFNGAYNADCHPGNVLLLEDGRLGLLDYGQVKRMEVAHRVTYARLIVALALDRRAEVVRLHFDEVGVRTRHRNESVGYLAAAFYHDRDTEDVMGGLDPVGFMEALEAADPMVRLPEPYLLAMRGNMILRGVASVMGIKLRMRRMWLAEAQAFLRQQQKLSQQQQHRQQQQ